MENTFLLYGAYGYTGALIAELAAARGLRPVLAGRDAAKLHRLANRLHLPFRAFDLNDKATLHEVLAQTQGVLHAAGPYSATVRPMVEACLYLGKHYLDITGELEVFEWIATQGAAAQKAGITLMPGVGFDVVPSDCLAKYLHTQLPDATHLEIAIKTLTETSRGTTLTMLEQIPKGSMIREDGALKSVPLGFKERTICFAEGVEMPCAAAPWGDISTAYHTTGIPNITTYLALDAKFKATAWFANRFGRVLAWSPLQSFLQWQVRGLVHGPSIKTRQTARCYIWGEVRNAQGDVRTAVLHTPEAYQLTVHTALEATLRVMAGKSPAGFQTPAGVFGADFVLEFEGVERF